MNQEPQANAPGSRARRSSRERRTVVVLNVVLLVIAAALGGPGALGTVVAGVQEERECGTMRSILADHTVQRLEQGDYLDPGDDQTFAGLDGLASAISSNHFDVLAAQSFAEACQKLSDARAKLRGAEGDLTAAKSENLEIDRGMTESAVAMVERLRRLVTLCSTDGSAHADCLAISQIPEIPERTIRSRQDIERRAAELLTEQKAIDALSLQHHEVKQILEAESRGDARLVALARDLLRNMDRLEQDARSQSELRAKLRSGHRKVRQQMAAIRLYCEAPIEAPGARP